MKNTNVFIPGLVIFWRTEGAHACMEAMDSLTLWIMAGKCHKGYIAFSTATRV